MEAGAVRQPRNGQQRPGQLGLEDLDRGVLELGLFRGGAIGRGGERVDAGQRLAGAAAPAQVFGAPVHGNEGLRQADAGRPLQRQHDGAALAGHMNEVAVLQEAPRHVLRMHLDGGLRHVAEQAAERAGAAHAVPLVA